MTAPVGAATRSTGATALELVGLVAGYDGVPVVHDLDLAVAEGEVLALLGANGAGKTTTLLTVSGLLPPIRGSIRVAGEPVTHGRRVRGAAVAALARRGVAHVPEDRGLFFDLTVAEHLRLARPAPGRDRMTEADLWDRFPALEPLVDRRAGLLSGGEQQMLALARALVTRPSLLLVDEMSLGLAPIVVERLLPTIRRAADDGCAVVLVEQHVGLALEIADRAAVLTRGRVTLTGTTTEVAAQQTEIEATYLGDAPPPA